MQQRVFMIGWEYPPHNSGGLGVACEGLTHALADQNTELYFTLPYHFNGAISHMKVLECVDPTWASSVDASNPPFMAYATEPMLPKLEISKGISSHKLRALPQSELEQKVSQYASEVAKAGTRLKNSFDVIHAHDWMSFPAALKLSKMTHKPYIAHVHSTEFDRVPHGYGSNYIASTEYEGMKHAELVVAVSYYTKRLLVEKYGVDEKKIAVVYNGINSLLTPPDPGKHHFAPKRPVIVFMGRLTMQKGAEFFLDLARSVLRKLPSALFVVAGQGDMYHELLFKTAYDGLSASVVFSGFMRSKQKDTLLDRADIFVMPSVSEPFGLVALEAAQRHTPVITSRNAGVSEVLKGSIMVDFWDIDKMTSEIIRLLEDKEHADQVRAKQIADIEKTTWGNSAQQLMRVYTKILTGKA